MPNKACLNLDSFPLSCTVWREPVGLDSAAFVATPQPRPGIRFRPPTTTQSRRVLPTQHSLAQSKPRLSIALFPSPSMTMLPPSITRPAPSSVCPISFSPPQPHPHPFCPGGLRLRPGDLHCFASLGLSFPICKPGSAAMPASLV